MAMFFEFKNWLETLSENSINFPTSLLTKHSQVHVPSNNYKNCSKEAKQTLLNFAKTILTLGNCELVTFIEENNHGAGELIIKSPATYLPIAFAFSAENERIDSLRFYHSHWPLIQSHKIREPLFDKSELAQDLPQLILNYHCALKNGSTETALSLIDPLGYVREPSGGRSGQGENVAVSHFFQNAFKDGGISLLYHSKVSQDSLIACEYTCYHWGKTEIPPQAGMEFFEITKENKFKAIRIYDDVSQPNI